MICPAQAESSGVQPLPLSPSTNEDPSVTGNTNSLIESIGVYLPSRRVSTAEILDGCASRIRVPLERLTGIKFRRRVEPGEFSIDLARKALADCLKASRWQPSDFDLIVCTNISRYDGERRVSCEPSTAYRLRTEYGLTSAIAFDLSNACAGMWSGVYLVDAMIRGGIIRRGLVVSGEYITHLTDTAQREIVDYMDPQLASLTLGDAGVAVALEASPSPQYGFHRIEMYTLSKYSKCCIAKAIYNNNGVAAMYTDAIKVTAAVVPHAVTHAESLLRRLGKPLDRVDHFVPHQTSQLSMFDAIKEIQSRFNYDLTERLINNLPERGNTSSTSHFLALRDAILEGRVRTGESIMFCISGSGQTTGTALYTCDNLPERMQAATDAALSNRLGVDAGLAFPVRLAIDSLGCFDPDTPEQADTIAMLTAAANACLRQTSLPKEKIDALISVGVYRTDFIMEPALAALVAGELAMNDDREPDDEDKTFAFDLSVGGVGFLQACFVASELARAGSIETAMVLASEIENNREYAPDRLLGVRETATAAILRESADGESGFAAFRFRYFPEHVAAIDTYGTWDDNGHPYLAIERADNLHQLYLDCMEVAVQEFLDEQGLERTDIAWLAPPQISPSFVSAAAQRLDFSSRQTVNIAAPSLDLFTSSTPLALRHLQSESRAQSGQLALLLEVGAGIQVACALYQF